MKTLLYTIACLCLSSLCHAADLGQKWALPEIKDGVANLIDYDHDEFVAMKILCRIQSGMKPTESQYLPVITDEGVAAARTYLMDKGFGFSRQDEFEQRRITEKLDAILKDGGDPFRTIAAVTHIRISMFDHIIKTYDFTKQGFPFRPGDRGFSAHVSLYDSAQPFTFEPIMLDNLPIDPDLAERWKSENGTLTALCKIGKGVSRRKVFPGLRVECQAIEFRSHNGELLKTVKIPASRRDINKDLTMEEVMNTANFAADVPVEEAGNTKKTKRFPAMFVIAALIVGAGWIAIKIRSSKSKRAP